MEKRGQFFLVAAIIIGGILFGVNSVSNSALGGNDQSAFYDLGDEVNFESKRVLDYGVYKGKNLESLLKGFLVEYAEYIAQERVLFVFGNEQGMKGIYFESGGSLGSSGISTGTIPSIIPIRATTQQNANVNVNNGIVYVEIEDVEYRFRLREGENFFFVIIKDNVRGGAEDEETFVATGR